MNNQMRAWVYYGPEEILLKEFSIPECGVDEIRVRVDACAVCGTDLKSFLVGNPRLKPPITIGHEFTGLVDVIGSGVRGFTLGDRVVMATSICCGECYHCKKGNGNLCFDVSPMGFNYNGGMADYVVIPALGLKNGHVVKVPEGVKSEYAALAEPISCAVNSCQNCNVSEGDTVVVVGAGPMGIMNACVARGFGVGKIIMVEVNEARLEQASLFGFDRLVNSAKEDLIEVVMAETDNVGADVIIVAAPAAAPQEDALKIVRKRGTVCLFASLPVGHSMLSMDSRLIHYGEICVVGASDSTSTQVAKAVELISTGRIPADKLASHILDFGELHKAYDLMKSGETLRVVLKP